ncbi:MAG: penicillin-binding transpeptidase domain-containing protein [Planctomycetota bacterium]
MCVLSGTASRVGGLRLPGLAVHGKTGTAEISEDTEFNNAWFAGFIGRGGDASIAFAAVAYMDRGHGADVGGEMIARFLARAAANPKTAEYLVR